MVKGLPVSHSPLARATRLPSQRGRLSSPHAGAAWLLQGGLAMGRAAKLATDFGEGGDPAAVEGPPARYRAFISYSHVDESVARRLHRWLETYRIPARLVGQITEEGAVPRRLSPIFRDRNELPASSSLDEAVKAALAGSASLIVLCSPDAAQSRWVGEEISYFRATHPDRPVLAALLRGAPEDAFPEALIDDGEAERKREPVAADFRKGGDGKLARLKLVAGLSGVALDEIVQRDAQRQLRRVMVITLGMIVSTLILAMLLIVALEARNEAERQRQQAEGLIEFMLTDLRSRLQGVGRLDILGSVNERALAYYGAQGDLGRLPSSSLERRARVLQAMGADDQRRGAFDMALNEYREARRTTSALLAEKPNDPQRIFTHAQSEFFLGYIDYQRSRYATARPHFQAYLDLARRLVAIDPHDVRALREYGYAQGNICSLELSSKANVAQALGACRSALLAMQQVAAASPADAEVRNDLANRHAWMADALRASGRMREALAERQEQARIVDDLLRSDPINAGYRQSWMLSRYSIATLFIDLGDMQAARRPAREARAANALLIATDPQNRDWRLWRKRIADSFPDFNKEN